MYGASSGFPSEERFGLTAEVRKTARSVVYNIAEGHRRNSTADYVRFLDIAAGSVAELETQLLLVQALGYLDDALAQDFIHRLAEIERMLAALMTKLRRRRPLRRPARSLFLPLAPSP
jgi:four helix bundle protein